MDIRVQAVGSSSDEVDRPSLAMDERTSCQAERSVAGSRALEQQHHPS